MMMATQNNKRERKTGRTPGKSKKITVDYDSVRFVCPSGPDGPGQPKGPHMRTRQIDNSSLRFSKPLDPRASRPLDLRASGAYNAQSAPHAPRPPLPPGIPKPMEDRKSADMGRGDFIRSGGAGILAAAIGLFQPKKKSEPKE